MKYQCLTKQIRGFIEISKNSKKTFVLIIKKGTTLSRPLISAVKEAKGIIIELGSDGAKVLSTPFLISEDILDIYLDSISGKPRYY